MDRFGSEIGSFRREWLLSRAPTGAPFVIFLAGTGATAEWAARETDWAEFAVREGFALAIPEALPPDPTAPPSFLTNPPRWNDHSEIRNSEWGIRNLEETRSAEFGMRNEDRKTSEAGSSSIPHSEFRTPNLREFRIPNSEDDVAFLAAVIDDAIARLGVDPRRVFVTGFSNGATMTFRVAAELADRVTAIAPVAGYCWVRDPRPSRPVPTLYTVGANDLLVPLRGGEVRSPWENRIVRRPPIAESLERWAKAIGCDPIPVLQRENGTVRVERYPGPVAFESVTVEGLGHHWPGGGAQLNPRIAGPPSAAFDATAAIWAFFQQHSLSAAT